MSSIFVLNESYMPTLEFAASDGSKNFAHGVEFLMQQYIDKLPDHPTSSSRQALEALGWLLQNLAFLHPLGDLDGRSRLLLMQHELRRLGIARGTFIYNNNKDIYFETLDVLTSKIEEGIQMYNKAAASGLNPWTDKFNVNRHAQQFGRPVDVALRACWVKNLNSGNYGTVPALHETINNGSTGYSLNTSMY